MSPKRRSVTYIVVVYFLHHLRSLLAATKVCDIIQVGAICGERVFNAYSLPNRPIDERATEVNGLAVDNGRLCLQGEPLDTIPITEALTSFITFLRSFPGPVILAAHNAKRFDAAVLNRVLQQYSLLEEFQLVVTGFVDTIEVARNHFPGSDNGYSLRALVSDFLERDYNAHNAVDDATILQELYLVWELELPEVLNSMF